MYHIGTDGACKGNPGLGSWAFCVFKDGKILGSKSDAVPNTTNNEMELVAVLEALKWVAKTTSQQAILYIDSNFVYKGLTEWLPRWVKRGGRNSQGNPVAHYQLFKEADMLLQLLAVKLVKVKGHSGEQHNEAADRVCNETIKKFLAK